MGMKMRFHLPGLRYNYPLNMLLLGMIKEAPEFFHDDIEIASFFGEFPTALWAGGRFCGGDQCDAAFIKAVVATYNHAGVPVRYTFTNPSISEYECKDPYCNFCMEVADNGMNEVLVVSKTLEDYIRRKYPNFKINSSTCKEIKNLDSLNYELNKDYNLVVLDYNLNNNWEFLEKIEKKEKCELLINSCCIPNCPRRGKHYETIGDQQRAVLINRDLPKNRQITVPGWQCEYGDKNNLYKIMGYSTFISPEAIREKYMPMGFNNFKIEGRTGNMFNLVDSYAYWLMKPEKRDEGRMLLINNLTSNKIINVSKPRPGQWP